MRNLSFIIIAVVMILTSCSMFPEKIYTTIYLSSADWYDDNSILIYAKKKKVYIVTDLWSNSEQTEWVKGEIWKINVQTGEKTLLYTGVGYKYYEDSYDRPVRPVISSGERGVLLFINNNTYLINDNYASDWNEYLQIKNSTWSGDEHFRGINSYTPEVIEVDINTSDETHIMEIDFLGDYSRYSMDYNSKNNSYAIWTDKILVVWNDIGEKKMLYSDSANLGIGCQLNECKQCYIDDEGNFIISADWTENGTGFTGLAILNDSFDSLRFINIENCGISPKTTDKYILVSGDSNTIFDVYDINRNFIKNITDDEITEDAN